MEHLKPLHFTPNNPNFSQELREIIKYQDQNLVQSTWSCNHCRLIRYFFPDCNGNRGVDLPKTNEEGKNIEIKTCFSKVRDRITLWKKDFDHSEYIIYYNDKRKSLMLIPTSSFLRDKVTQVCGYNKIRKMSVFTVNILRESDKLYEFLDLIDDLRGGFREI